MERDGGMAGERVSGEGEGKRKRETEREKQRDRVCQHLSLFPKCQRWFIAQANLCRLSVTHGGFIRFTS